MLATATLDRRQQHRPRSPATNQKIQAINPPRGGFYFYDPQLAAANKNETLASCFHGTEMRIPRMIPRQQCILDLRIFSLEAIIKYNPASAGKLFV